MNTSLSSSDTLCLNRRANSNSHDAGRSIATAARPMRSSPAISGWRQRSRGATSDTTFRLPDPIGEAQSRPPAIVALLHFQPDRGARFSTVCGCWWIKAAIHDYILRSCGLVTWLDRDDGRAAEAVSSASRARLDYKFRRRQDGAHAQGGRGRCAREPEVIPCSPTSDRDEQPSDRGSLPECAGQR